VVYEPAAQGTVSLTFDDGLLSDYSVAYPLMESFGFKGTAHVIAEWPNETYEERPLMTTAELHELQDAGWEIGSHTLTHKSLPGLSDEELDRELSLSKQVLEERGFSISTIAFPYGHFDSRVMNYSEPYYIAARPLFLGYNNLSHLQNYRLNAFSPGINDSVEDVCSWIYYAKQNSLWLILVFHYIGDEEKPMDISREKFKGILDCIKNSGILVKNLRDVIRRV
jgi:peptidoglycan/xylan/chitin deacetylase (PgdA/CDA1 family)